MAKKQNQAAFKDAHGREWVVKFDGASMREIYNEIGVNLCEAMAGPDEFVAKLGPVDAMGMVWIAIRDRAEEIDVDQHDFLSGLYGDSLIAMNDAFWAAIVNFSQPEKIRDKMTKMMSRAKKIASETMDEKLGEVEEMSDEKIRQLVEEAIDQAASPNGDSSSTESSSSSPDTSELTRAG